MYLKEIEDESEQEMRDSQRSKVYTWEQNLSSEEELTSMQCEKLAERICKAYDCTTPRIKFINSRHGGALYCYDHVIKLPWWARNRLTLLHELSHAILHRKIIGWNTLAAHGPEFVALYIDLLSRYRIAHKKELLRSAKQAKINIATSDARIKPSFRV